MMALCLAREDAVEGWREMLGPKEVSVAAEQAPDRYSAHGGHNIYTVYFVTVVNIFTSLDLDI